MANANTYSVIVSGQLKDGFDPSKIQDAFAALLKVPPEKAASLMRRKWVIKKNVDEQTAAVYKKKLESIGLVIGLQEHSPPPPSDSGFALALEPTTEEQQAQQQSAPHTAASPGTVNCPKCGTEQPTGAEQCQSCGVFLHKVLAQASTAKNTQQTQPQEDQEVEDSSEVTIEENLTGKSIAAGAAAALLGAVIWNIVGNVFDYELGIVAWGIGGAVGYAVAITGSSGDKAAMICAALALLAILGGKYMLYSGFKDDISQLVTDNVEDLQSLYDVQMEAVEAYANVTDEQSLRSFMVDYEYSESTSPDGITDDEIELFRTESEPQLSRFVLKKPDYGEWVQATFAEPFGEISTIDLIKENFGILDIIFLFLGVGTAFRLGRGISEQS